MKYRRLSIVRLFRSFELCWSPIYSHTFSCCPMFPNISLFFHVFSLFSASLTVFYPLAALRSFFLKSCKLWCLIRVSCTWTAIDIFDPFPVISSAFPFLESLLISFILFLSPLNAPLILHEPTRCGAALNFSNEMQWNSSGYSLSVIIILFYSYNPPHPSSDLMDTTRDTGLIEMKWYVSDDPFSVNLYLVCWTFLLGNKIQ